MHCRRCTDLSPTFARKPFVAYQLLWIGRSLSMLLLAWFKLSCKRKLMFLCLCYYMKRKYRDESEGYQELNFIGLLPCRNCYFYEKVEYKICVIKGISAEKRVIATIRSPNKMSVSCLEKTEHWVKSTQTKGPTTQSNLHLPVQHGLTIVRWRI